MRSDPFSNKKDVSQWHYFILGYFSTKLDTFVDGHGNKKDVSQWHYFILGYFSTKLDTFVDGHGQILT
jgi:hypothetical protein